MKADEFQALIAGLAKLSAHQRETLLQLLSGPPPEAAVVAMLESKDADQRQCPHCAGKRILAWGKSHGLPRYRCGDCRRTFNALTGTPLARLRHKGRWLTQGTALQDGLSVRNAAAACGVAVSTAFRWRHHVPHDGFDGCAHYAPSYRWQSRSRYCTCAGFLSATPGGDPYSLFRMIIHPPFTIALYREFRVDSGFFSKQKDALITSRCPNYSRTPFSRSPVKPGFC